MIWAPDLDDFSGRFCNQGTYPLMKTVVNLVRTGVIVPVVIPTTPLTTPTTTKVLTPPTTSTTTQPTRPPTLPSSSQGKEISSTGIFRRSGVFSDTSLGCLHDYSESICISNH